MIKGEESDTMQKQKKNFLKLEIFHLKEEFLLTFLHHTWHAPSYPANGTYQCAADEMCNVTGLAWLSIMHHGTPLTTLPIDSLLVRI